jgi:DNA gyrase/topoisomerase IV subunit A
VTNDLYQTKRKRNFTFQDSDSEKETVQQIYILRESGKNYKKKPNKYFRIPLLSHDVKIVEVVQEDEGHEMESTENKSTFQKEQQNFFKEYKDYRKISHFKTESFTSKKYISEAHENCKGCKYCSLLKEMK